MKKLFFAFTIIASLMSSTAFAAIGCLPGQCGGAPTPPPDDGLTPPRPSNPSRPPIPEYPYTADVSGYYELTSPDCSDADLAKAKIGAEEEAFEAAVKALGTDEIEKRAPTTFITVKCAKGKWSVHIVEHYNR